MACALIFSLTYHLRMPWAISAILLNTTLIIAFYMEFENTHANTRIISLLGFITAVTIVSRQIIHGMAISPVFFFVILTGYVFGPVNGFVVGSSTIFVSNFFVGGHGPWTPFQMIGLGMVGFLSSYMPHPKNGKAQILMLSAFGVLASFFYSAVTDVFWWMAFTSQHTLKTYLAISSAGIVFSLARAFGNVLLLFFFGSAFIKVFTRFRDRFFVEYVD